MADETPQTTPPTPPTPPAAAGQPATVRPAAIGVRPAPFTPPGSPRATQIAVPAPSGPATIRLKPVVPPAPVPHAPAAGDVAPTVRVRPVIAGQQAAPVAPAAPVPAPAAPAAPGPAGATPPKPGSQPLPPGPKPLKPEQVQAAKAKTSRISLDAALIGGAQEDRGGPKTIRLKRPTDAPVGKITSHLGSAAAAATASQQAPVRPPASRLSASLVPPIPTEPPAPVVNRFTTAVSVDAVEEPSNITRRKTIRVKRPGAPASVASAGVGQAEAGQVDETAPTAHVATDTVPLAPAERVNPFFPVLAVATIFVLIALVIVLVAPDSKLFDVAAWPPNAPSLGLPGMAPIPGRG